MKKEMLFIYLISVWALVFVISCGSESPVGVIETGDFMLHESDSTSIIDTGYTISDTSEEDTLLNTYIDTNEIIVDSEIDSMESQTDSESVIDTNIDTFIDTIEETFEDTVDQTQNDSIADTIFDTIDETVEDTVVEDTVEDTVEETIVDTDTEDEFQGQISWVLTTRNVPSDIEQRITAAMNAAVERYNRWGNWSARTLTVEYNTGVATADGNINGNIRFGTNTSYMTECTAMHEIAHTYGVGTSPHWGDPLIQNWQFVGENALAKLREFDGQSAGLSTGGGHFWPYGLNYNSEWSPNNGDRHAQIVWAMMLDGLYWNY